MRPVLREGVDTIGGKLEGADKLSQQLNELADKASGGRPTVAVGYTAANALALHENGAMKLKGFSRDPRIRRIELGGDPAKARPRPRKREPKGRFWDPQGRGKAKFLEDPAKNAQAKLPKTIEEGMRAGKDLAGALLVAGLELQRDSQLECPVDTGNTKASAFTRLE